ncbi:MAG: hypothetical protein A2004_03940 [Spirochaetes bacterium GWC1_61_12]|nr:MAG: hypothetical protein A2Y37_06115 [Spirochaetes bacterium GWB1_60_80]OHD34979.1 MAG: hypothetical protein A2004_03940 [Spirochaetes bacterium GWC1_61_12]OHD43072.1 MAG: hypothetical protein A2Y35_01500 [Spirochaetes bacterium GWE1_60_18]OHD59668.1 MAG: hypothetical protein A2Y32_12375 [Spirochaetes bacterium GWF1_60_12]HAP44105.1 hypothetical protein [Spirochaetaceae bacterium]
MRGIVKVVEKATGFFNNLLTMLNQMNIEDRDAVWTTLPTAALTKLTGWREDNRDRASPDATFRGYIKEHSLAVPTGQAWAQSIVVAATAFPPRRLPFVWQGKTRSILQPAAVPTADATAPLHQAAYPGPALHAACQICRRCLAACPTRAIPDPFGQIKVERCLPLWNETDRDLPADIPATAANALMGCVLCQRQCPINAVAWAKPLPLAPLTEAETALLLGDVWNDQVRALLARIVNQDDAAELQLWHPRLRRNLADFIASGRTE